MLGLNRPEIEKLLAEATTGAGSWVPNCRRVVLLTVYDHPYPPTPLAEVYSDADARLMAAAPELARQCLALLDRAEAAERDRDAARRQGAEEERGRIVKRLRYEADNPSHSARTGVAIDDVASAIERGDHLEAP
jgi:hypothetical protein